MIFVIGSSEFRS